MVEINTNSKLGCFAIGLCEILSGIIRVISFGCLRTTIVLACAQFQAIRRMRKENKHV